MQWIELTNAQAIAERAVKEILQCAETAIRERGCFKLVLAGGSTPALTYSLLAIQGVDFSCWLFFLGDERCLPVEHADRNSQLILQTLIEPAEMSPDQFYAIPAELGAEAGALAYAQTLQEHLPFDCVLLGMGEDGHTASIFPGHMHPGDVTVMPVYEAPKPPPDRISLTAEALNTAPAVIFLIAGAGKSPAVTRWKRGDPLPVATVKGKQETLVLIDSAANA